MQDWSDHSITLILLNRRRWCHWPHVTHHLVKNNKEALAELPMYREYPHRGAVFNKLIGLSQCMRQFSRVFCLEEWVLNNKNPNLQLICNFGKIQMWFQNELGPIVQPLLYEEIVLAKMLRNWKLQYIERLVFLCI